MIVPIVLDCEASGLEPESYPIEIGYVLPNSEVVSYYIKPEEDWTHWCEKAQDVHQVSRESLFECGLPAYIVAEKLNSQLANEIVYSDAASYEIMWLDRLFDSVGIERKFDVRSIQSLFIDEDGVYQHGFFYRERKMLFLGDDVTHHKAGDDAFVIQKAYVRSKSIAEDLLKRRV